MAGLGSHPLKLLWDAWRESKTLKLCFQREVYCAASRLLANDQHPEWFMVKASIGLWLLSQHIYNLIGYFILLGDKKGRLRKRGGEATHSKTLTSP